MKNYYKYLLELRNRIIILITTWLFLFCTCYKYKKTIFFSFVGLFNFEQIGLTEGHFIYTDITELFSTNLNVLLLVTNQIMFFYTLYAIFLFMAPGFNIIEYKKMKKSFVLLLCLYVIVLTILNKLVLPFSLKFFLTFYQHLEQEAQPIYFEAKISQYLKYYQNLYFTSLFNIFLLVTTSIIIDNVNQKIILMKKLRRFLYCFFLLISTLSTPPDIISQIFLTILLSTLYEFRILLKIVKQILVR